MDAERVARIAESEADVARICLAAADAAPDLCREALTLFQRRMGRRDDYRGMAQQALAWGTESQPGTPEARAAFMHDVDINGPANKEAARLAMTAARVAPYGDARLHYLRLAVLLYDAADAV